MILQSTIDNLKPIHYWMHNKDKHLFFPTELTRKVDWLNQKIGTTTQISIYPDATLKSNGLPTGIACSALSDDSILMPFLLRDPGCGFLQFKLTFNHKEPINWHHNIGKILDNFKDNIHFLKIHDSFIKKYDLNTILNKGLPALSISEVEMGKFIHSSFQLSEEVKLNSQEYDTLTKDLMQFSNTIEIRKIKNIQNQELLNRLDITQTDYIGFVHMGSLAFPRMLGEKFIYSICDYAYKNNYFSLNDLDHGIYGVHLRTTLGRDYANWLKASMNYALVSRYLCYLAIKETLEKELNCTVTMINDNIHAGLLTEIENGKEVITSTRGVQHIYNESERPLHHTLSLLAGHRETDALLVTGGKNTAYYSNHFSHGTSYYQCEHFSYESQFTTEQQETYIKNAKNVFYNTEPALEDVFSYTFNLQHAAGYFVETGLIQHVAELAPLINIQSDWLKTDTCNQRKAINKTLT